MERYLPQSIHRSFVHGKWWHNDPDCVLVRREGTPHDQALSQKGLSLEEARFFVTVVGLTQGIQMVGERMTVLEEERLRLLDAIRPLMPAPAQPVDVFFPQPEQLHLTTPHGDLVAFLNWGEETIQVAPPWERLEASTSDQPWLAYELWTKRALDCVVPGEFRLEVPPHGSRILFLRSATSHPVFGGFSGHVSCGAALLEEEKWDGDKGELGLVFNANTEGDLKLHCPAGWSCREESFLREADQVWSQKISKGRHHFQVRFEPKGR